MEPQIERPMPQPAGIAGVRHRWVEVRGVRLHVAEFGDESGGSDPVLLLHGFPQHWFAWRKLVPLLPGHRLICVDLRGFGWSQQTKRGYDIEGLGRDVLALLDELSLDRVVLVAHDWGAQVGFRLCLRAPERVGAYLALNMVHPWPRHLSVLRNLWRMWFTAVVEYPVLGRWILRRRPGFARFLLRYGVADPSAWRAADLDEFAAATAVSAHAGQSMFWQYVLRDIPALLLGTHRRLRLAVPTVILGGTHDPVIPPDLLSGGERYADDLTVRMVPSAGHLLHEECPEVVAESLRALQAQVGRSADSA